MSDGTVAGTDAFSRLHPDVREALSERGFSTPTEPQRTSGWSRENASVPATVPSLIERL